MIEVRRAEDRGNTRTDWLDSHHTFSFADYYDVRYHQFRTLRVFNEDFVKPGKGFGKHFHRDMEILSYVLEGSLAHRDSSGGDGVIRPGEWQRMSAGSGISHSEYNGSQDEQVHFLQIWILPNRKGIPPGYEQKEFPASAKTDQWRIVASPEGENASLVIHQDAKVYNTVLSKGAFLSHELKARRFAWIQIVRGEVRVNGCSLKSSDGAAIGSEPEVKVQAVKESEIILFDLA